MVIGGGFYGCCLALFLRSIANRIVVVEAGAAILERASRVNQARIHTGFHYPRSAITAMKSMVLHRRFVRDFSEAVVDDFQMLYAVAKRRSKVSAKRFFRTYSAMGAPIAPANPAQVSLFNPETIEAVFAVREHAFDYSILRQLVTERLDAAGVRVMLNSRALSLKNGQDQVRVELASGQIIRARYAFNVTYSAINDVLHRSDLPPARLKHELTELALIAPPPELDRLAATVMDGPFFSVMPYPVEKLYSLSHVRYTPHLSWTDSDGYVPQPCNSGDGAIHSRARHMLNDGRRYLRCLSEATHVRSIYEVKTVLLKNEKDDARPILYQRQPASSRIISIMGGKIDNIFDLLDLVATEPGTRGADDRYLRGNPSAAGADT